MEAEDEPLALKEVSPSVRAEVGGATVQSGTHVGIVEIVEYVVGPPVCLSISSDPVASIVARVNERYTFNTGAA